MPELFWGGLVQDVKDSRDYKTDIFFGAPEPFDWNKGYDIEKDIKATLPVNFQGQSYSCVSQSKSKDREVKEFIETNNYQLMSARSIYALRPNKPAEGMQFRDACDIELNIGVAYRKDVPDYETEAEMNNEDGIKQAIKTKSLSYLSFNYFNNIDNLAAHIRDYAGAMIGFDGYNNGTFFSEHPTFPTNINQVKWSHAVFAGKAKIVNGEKRVYFLNSWGEGCGNLGWQYLTEEDLKPKDGDYTPFSQGRVTVDLKDKQDNFMAEQFLKDNEGKLIQMTGDGATGEFATIVNGVVRTGDTSKVLATYLVRKEGCGIPKELWNQLPIKPVDQK